MAQYLVSEGYLTAIADAIRGKLNVATTYTPAEMSSAINQIQVATAYSLSELTVTPSETQQIFTPTSPDIGYSKVTVNNISPSYVGSEVPRQAATIITPTSSQQTAVTSGKYTTGNIVVGAVPSETKTITTNGTHTPTTGKWFSSVTVNIPTGSTINNQNKTVSPTETQQNVSFDSGYTGLGTVTIEAISSTYVGSNVTRQAAKTVTPTTSSQTALASNVYTTGIITVAAIPSNYIIPTGNKTITSNGSSIDVAQYATVSVNVPTGSTINNEDITITATESQQIINPSSGHTGIGTVTVTPISSTYVGSGIASRSSSNLTVSGATVTAPAGYYSTSASKSVASGTAGTPTATKGSVSNHSVLVTPSVTNTTGYITGSTKTGTAITVTASELVSGNKAITSNGTNIDVTNYATVSVNVASGGSTINNQSKTIDPTENQIIVTPDSGYTGLDQVTVTAIADDYIGSAISQRTSTDVTASGATVTVPDGYYDQVVTKSVASGTAGTPTATKGTVSNHSISVTPKVTNTTGYITGSTKTGTAVTVSASELVSGTKSIITNGTTDIKEYAFVEVNIPTSGGTLRTLTLNDSSLWVKNASFLNTSAVGSSYAAVMNTASQTGNRIVLLQPLAVPNPVFTIYGNTGFDVAICAFDSNQQYLGGVSGNPGNGYIQQWASFTTGVGKNLSTIGSYIGIVLRYTGSSPALEPANIADAGFRIEYIGAINLQTKTNITPTTSSQTISPDSGYDGLSSVQINAIPSQYKNTSDADAVAANILSGKIAYNSTGKITGSMTNNGATGGTITTQGGTYTIPAGYTSGGTVTATLAAGSTTASNISGAAFEETTGDYGFRASVQIQPGYYASATTVTKDFSSILPAPTTEGTAAQVLAGYDLYNHDGQLISGTMTNNSIGTITLDQTTTSYTIPAGYHDGTGKVQHTTVNIPDPTISVSAAGVVTASGSWTRGFTTDNSYSKTYNLTTLAATTYNTSSTDQTITNGKYITGTQTIRAVTTSNISAANVKAGVTVQVGDSADSDRIIGVTGTFTSDADAVAADLNSGKTAYVNGSKITGSQVINKFYTGSSAPSSSLGSNGDIYLQE